MKKISGREAVVKRVISQLIRNPVRRPGKKIHLAQRFQINKRWASGEAFSPTYKLDEGPWLGEHSLCTMKVKPYTDTSLTCCSHADRFADV
jgi:hypothetical protein